MDNATYRTEAPFSVPQILAGGTYTTRKVTLLSGENRAAGTAVGKITASGKYKLSASAAGDGSEVIALVLAQDCDASAGDKEVLCYETAQIVASALILGAGHTIASVREGMRDIGLVIDD